ncbi:hypothetical protein [Cesiribacter andamanensis]|uniref:Uncharacterized protein n=1 Tax=Cesiribacter andamanensis AMV16 TaxID=1279009 RepID=M7N8A2_9BACT|nr:hypothetical protein [Cesiribacter andamanensis]EMR03492.1 hypothetical protein ADICEAN_01341 [Cesiribacter andamanensis AMV16]
MKPLYVPLLLGLLAPAVLISCGGNEAPQEEAVALAPPPPAPAVDSAQLRFVEQQELLAQGQASADQAIKQLRQLSGMLQDSIANTELPAQLQEEFIWAYRNRLHEVGQARQALENWKQRQQYYPADSLPTAEKVEIVQRELDDLEALLLQARVARREARESLEEATQAVQPVEEEEQQAQQQQ